MSYCQLIPFKDGLPLRAGHEFRNAWGGAAFIWSSLYERFLKDENKRYDSWLSCYDKDHGQRLWNLALDERLESFEKSVHAFTFDRFFVRHEHFRDLARDLRLFSEKYPPNGKVSHLSEWASLLENSTAESMALYATSVGENLWWKYDEEKDESSPVSLAEGTEVYDWLAQIKGHTIEKEYHSDEPEERV